MVMEKWISSLQVHYLNGKILWYQNDGLGGFNERSIKDDDDIRGSYYDFL
jgi:hypothetical protein